MDSNFRYRGRRPASGRSLRAQRVETDAAKREFGSGSCLFAPPWSGSGGLGGGLCFPFPTPGNGQQESRLAPIGRHLRLLRRGVLRTGCFPRQAEVVPEHVAAGDVWIATGVDGEIAGVVALAPGDAPDTLNLNKLFVEPRHIRSGVGRALLAHAVAEARQRGSERL